MLCDKQCAAESNFWTAISPISRFPVPLLLQARQKSFFSRLIYGTCGTFRHKHFCFFLSHLRLSVGRDNVPTANPSTKYYVLQYYKCSTFLSSCSLPLSSVLCVVGCVSTYLMLKPVLLRLPLEYSIIYSELSIEEDEAATLLACLSSCLLFPSFTHLLLRICACCSSSIGVTVSVSVAGSKCAYIRTCVRNV